jgi:hypothetical protein
VEEEDFERYRGGEMQQMDVMLSESMEPTVLYPPHGSVPEERPKGVFRGMLVQLNGMVTRKVKNRKARMIKSAVQKYGVQIIGLGEVGVNLKKAKVKRLLTLLPYINRATLQPLCSAS